MFWRTDSCVNASMAFFSKVGPPHPRPPLEPWLASSWSHAIIYNGCQQEHLLDHTGSLLFALGFPPWISALQ